LLQDFKAKSTVYFFKLFVITWFLLENLMQVNAPDQLKVNTATRRRLFYLPSEISWHLLFKTFTAAVHVPQYLRFARSQ